ncbi:MAG: hypothetical protein JWR12_3027 [Mucilaginibacter sp.]|nr:hypothetical protein [Mucilaginibacter sp.]
MLFNMQEIRAQVTITGKLLDNKGSSVGFAGVMLYRIKDSALVRTAISDTTGKFVLNNVAVAAYFLKVSHTLYRDTVLNIDSSKLGLPLQLNIILNERSAHELKAVTITGRKRLIERLIDRTVFNVENSVAVSGGDALDALKKAPGVQVNGNNSINLTGKSSVKVMVNDRIVNLSGDDLIAMLKSMSADDISKIELITSPPAKYDAGGNSGLINIVTKKNKVDGFSGNMRFSVTQATYAAGNIAGDLAYRSKDLSISGNVNATSGDFLRSSTDYFYYPTETWSEHQSAKNHSRNLNGSLGIDYQLSQNQLIGIKYTGFYSVDTSRNTTLTNVTGSSGVPEYVIKTTSNSPVKSKNNDLNIHYEAKLDTAGKKLTIDADYFTFNKNLNQFYSSNNFQPNGQSLNQQTNVQSYSPQTIKVYTVQNDEELPYKFFKLAFGGKLSFIQNYSQASYYNIINSLPVFDAAQSNRFNYKENTQALYLNGSKNADKWNFQLGLRGEFTQTAGYSAEYDQTNESKYFKLFPTVYLTYKKDDNNVFSFTYGKRITRPDYWRLNPFRLYASPYSYSEGNPFLQPAYTNNFELIYNYKDWFSTTLYASIQNNAFDQIGIPDSLTKVIGIVERNFLKVYNYGLILSATLNMLNWMESDNQAQIYYNNSLSSDPHTQKQVRGLGAYLSTDNTIFLNASKTFLGSVSFWYQFPEISGVDRNSAYSDLDMGFKLLLAKKRLTLSINGTDILRTNKPTYHSVTNGEIQTYNNYNDNQGVRISLNYKFGGNNKPLRQSNKSSNDTEKSRTH